MLSYAPLYEEEAEIGTVVQPKRTPPSVPPEMLTNKKKGSFCEETECNVIVMMFVIGVVMLAVLDSTKR